jgi:hypothetical protein
VVSTASTGGDLDCVDVRHRRGVDDDVHVGHRIPQARRVADVAGEEPAAVVVEAAVRRGQPRLVGVEQAEGADVRSEELVGEQRADRARRAGD